MSAVELFTELSDALIVVMPPATGVANPSLPPALLIVATPKSVEFQVTRVVMSCVVASE